MFSFAFYRALSRTEVNLKNYYQDHDSKIIGQWYFFSKKKLARNEYLKIAGSIDTDIYFVEDGSLRIFIMDENEERVVRFGYAGNILVSLDSIEQ